MSRKAVFALFSLVVCLLLVGGWGCGGDDGSGNDLRDSDRPGTNDVEPQDEGGTPGELLPVPEQSGVVYLSHYHSEELRYYRVDGDTPKDAGSIDLGSVTKDLALDPHNDLLFVALDQTREVVIYRVSRPESADDEVAEPEELARIDAPGDKVPHFVRVNPRRQRLYVVVSPPFSEKAAKDLVTEYTLLAYDISDPEAPKTIEGSPYTIPVTAEWDLDAGRDLLFVVNFKGKRLHVYDLRGDGFKELEGEPLDLQKLYPEENHMAFTPRTLAVDPYRSRLYAARSQADLSELIAFEYPSALPTKSDGYAKLATYSDLQRLDDPFDTEIDSLERPNLLDAFVPMVDLERGYVFLSSGAYAGMHGIRAMVTAMDEDLSLGKGCDDFEGFGCWYQAFDNGKPDYKLVTDGAACVDYTHRVVVGTSYDVGDESLPGNALFFRYEDDLSMTPWLPEDEKLLRAGALPISAVCH